MLGAFLAQDLILFVAFFDLMLIPFYFLVGSWGTGDRVRATIKMVIYTMVGLVPDARRRGRHRRDRLQRPRHRDQLHLQRAAAPAALAHRRGLDLPGLRARVPREDADRAVPRLAGRRLQVDADPGRRGLLRRRRQGRELRLPADRAAAVPARLAPLPGADADHRAGLDHVGHRDGVHHRRRTPRDRLLERRADGLHPARHLLAAAPGRPGRAAADAQPRRRHRRLVLRGRRRRGARRRQRAASTTWAASPSRRRCWRPSS